MAVTDWSSTAANNTTLGGIALGEGVMLVADVNDAFRELMAQVAAALGVSIQQYDAGLASIAGLTTAADRMIYTTASDTYAVATLTSFARTLLDDADAATARATLDVDQAGTDNSTDVTLAGALDYLTIAGQVITRNPIDLTTDVTGDLPVAEGGTGASTAGDARTNLGVAIGSDVQAHDADLDALAALASTGILARTAANTYALRTVAAGTGIGVTNGNGVSGNPTVAINDAELLALAGLTSAANKVPYFTGSGTAGLLDFVDEDNMTSDSATAVPSQQSVKAYVDANGGGGVDVDVQDFTSSGTWSKPAFGTRSLVIIEILGGGGGGGAGQSGSFLSGGGGSGGGGGGYNRHITRLDELGASETVTIGAAGSGGATEGGNGTAGGTTTFGSLLSAAGGAGGNGGANDTNAAAVSGGAPTSMFSSTGINGATSGVGAGASTPAAGGGAASPFMGGGGGGGGGAAGNGENANAGAGSSSSTLSPWSSTGGDGGSVSSGTAQASAAGTGRGAGGGGGAGGYNNSHTNGSAGTAGACRVTVIDIPD